MAKHVCTSDCVPLDVNEAAAFWRTEGEGIARDVATRELGRLAVGKLLPNGHTDGVTSDGAAAVKRALSADGQLVHDIVDDTRFEYGRRAAKGQACRTGSPGLVHRIAQRRTWRLGAKAAKPALRSARPFRDGADAIDLIWCIDDVEARLDARRVLIKLRKGLDSLEPDEARLISRVADGGGPKQIAAELGVPEGTVRSRLSRARAKLREVVGGAR